MIPQGWYVVMALIVIGNIALLVYWFSLQAKQKKKGDIAIVIPSHRAHGSAIGIIRKQDRGAGGRFLIELEPKDKDLEKLDDKKIDLKNEPLIVPPECFISFAKGAWSYDENIHIVFPSDPEDMPESFKNTPFGLAVSFFVREQQFVEKRLEILQKKVTSRDALLTEIGDAEMSEELLQRVKGFHKDLVEMMLEAKETTKKKQDSFSALTQGVNPSHHG